MSNIKVYSIDQLKDIFTEVKDKVNSLQMIEMVGLKPFDECTWNDIVKISECYYSGLYSIDDIKTVWQIGDEKTFELPALEAGDGLSDTHVAQTVTMQLIDFEHYSLANSDNKKALTVFNMKNCLNEPGALDTDSYKISAWDGFARRNWCEGTFKSALPDSIKNGIKTVKIATYNGNTRDDLKFINADCFILSSKEYNSPYSRPGAGTPFSIYTNNASRIKTVNGSNANYWTRDHVDYSSSDPLYWHDYVTLSGDMSNDYPSSSKGLAIAFCI